MTGTLGVSHGGTGATTASNAVKALTGRAWDFNTANTTDTWVPVATTVNGVGTWQHRVIPTRLTTESETYFDFYSSTTQANDRGHLWQRGGIICFSVNGLIIRPSSYRIDIATIPEGWRPPTLFFGITGANTKVGIEADGRMWVDAESAGQQLWMSATWPLA
jgi:hypothetical protein